MSVRLPPHLPLEAGQPQLGVGLDLGEHVPGSQDVIAKILTHVNAAREPVQSDDAPARCYDVTGQPVPE